MSCACKVVAQRLAHKAPRRKRNLNIPTAPTPPGALTEVANASATNGQPAVSFASTFQGGEGAPSYPAGGAENCWDQTPESGSCQQQKDWGKCSESWLVDGGFCRATCGLCGGGATPSPAASSPASSSDTSSSDGGCGDTPVPSTISWGSCQQQKEWGNCAQSWLKDGGYCKATCSLCGEVAAPSSNEAGGCSDVAPPDGTTCQQQKDWGKVCWCLCGGNAGGSVKLPMLTRLIWEQWECT